MAYEYGSRSDLSSTSSRTTLKLLGLTPECRAQTIESRISRLRGVLSVSVSLPNRLASVDHVTSVITAKEVALELRAMGYATEATVRVRVDGMRCQSCVQSIEGQIAPLPGVSHISVSLQDGAALIGFRPLVVTPQELREKIEEMGFDATLAADDPAGVSHWEADAESPSPQTVVIGIGGMTCNSCVQSIEGGISQMAGVESAVVSLEEQTGTITFDPRLTEPEQLRAAVEDMGFEATLTGRRDEQMSPFIEGAFFSAPPCGHHGNHSGMLSTGELFHQPGSFLDLMTKASCQEVELTQQSRFESPVAEFQPKTIRLLWR